MGKEFKQVAFDPVQCRAELTDLNYLLESKDELSERQDILPFFQSHEQLSAYLGMYTTTIGPSREIVFEYPIVGNFKADLIVGNKPAGEFCFIEFEEGGQDTVFKNTGRSITEWNPKFEHGFSQIVDWFSLLDDLKKTDIFKKTFGLGYIRFSALLIIGRESGISEYDRLRMDWRSDKVLLDSQAVLCVTFDRIYKDLDKLLKLYTGQ